MQLDKALLAYEIDLRAENKSPKAIESCRHKLHFFVEWLARGDIGHVEGPKPGHINGFLYYLSPH